MPLTDWQLMQGAQERALAVQESLKSRRLQADIYVGLEGGFHSVSIAGEWHTFLRAGLMQPMVNAERLARRRRSRSRRISSRASSKDVASSAL